MSSIRNCTVVIIAVGDSVCQDVISAISSPAPETHVLKLSNDQRLTKEPSTSESSLMLAEVVRAIPHWKNTMLLYDGSGGK